MIGTRNLGPIAALLLASGVTGEAASQSIGTMYDMSRMLAAPHPFANAARPAPRPTAVPASQPTVAPAPVRPSAVRRATPPPAARRAPQPQAGRDAGGGGVWRIEYGNEDRSLAAELFDPLFGEGTDDGGLSWGWRFSYSPNSVPDWTRWLGRHLFWIDGSMALRSNYFVELDAVTPHGGAEDAGRPARPHVGFLGLGTRLAAHKNLGDAHQRIDHTDLTVGMLGPASGAKAFHNAQHDFIGSDAAGWNQIESEPFVNLGIETGRRVFVLEPDAIANIELYPHVGLDVGNALTQAKLGLSLRVGGNLERDLGPLRPRTLLSGENFPERGRYWAWNLFFGVETRAIAHSVFLDGNLFQDSHSVDKEPVVYDLQMGFEGGYGANRLSLVNVYRSREFENQFEKVQFIRAALSVDF